MTENQIQSELEGLKSFLPDSYKEQIEMKELSDGGLYIYYEGSKEDIAVNELEHYFEVFSTRKAYIKSIVKVEELKASIKYRVDFN